MEAGGYDKAYQVASTIVLEASKYPYRPVPRTAMLMAAILKHESGFNDSATSPTGSMGMPQFTRSTARLVSAAMGMQYSEDLLRDYHTSIRMQAVLLDCLYASYGDDRSKILSVYNLGRVEDSSAYTRAVGASMDSLLKGFEVFRIDLRKTAE